MGNLPRNGMIAAALFISGTANAADADIEALQRQIDVQSQQLNALSQQLNALRAQPAAVAAAPATPAAPVASAVPATVGSVGSFPGSFVIPGTNTSFKVGGFADLSVAYDANSTASGAGFLILNGFQPKGVTPTSITSLGSSKLALPGTPGAKQTGRLQASPRWSRVSLETRTPSDYGEIKFFVESDFEGDGLTANKNTTWSLSPRLRQAYGSIGNLTIGQTVMLVNDQITAPETLDNNAYVGYEAFNRIPAVQYRWNLDAAQKNQISVALESAYNDYLGADNGNFQSGGNEGQPTDNLSHIPDFSAKIARNGSWGRIFAAGEIRDIGVNNLGVPKVYGSNAAQTASDSVIGSALTAGGRLSTNL